MADYDAAPPFDPQALMQTLPQAPQQGPAPTRGFDKSKLLRLIPLVAAAAKGGPGALEGLLSGYQQHAQRAQQDQQQQAATQRQSMLDDRALQQTQFSQGLQLQQLQQQQEVARSGLVKEFSSALLSDDLDDPEAVRALTQLYEARGRALGVRPGTFETTAMQVVKPSTLETKAAQKKVTALRTQFGTKWMEEGAKFQHDLPGGKRVSFQQLLEMSGMTADPAAPAQAPAASEFEKSSIDVQAAAALRRGDTQEYARLLKVKKEVGQADDRVVVQTGGLSSKQTQQAQSQARTFETLPVVKNTQKISEAVAFVNGLNLNTKNPADDQALIYAFAKAMDPDSVVREGEYATVQKYSQSWLESFGFNAQRVLSNSEFLTPQARTNLKKTILARFNAARGQYDAVRQSYVTKVNKITGQQDGEEWLTDYGAAFPGASSAPGGRPAPGANPFRK